MTRKVQPVHSENLAGLQSGQEPADTSQGV
jgi:hypothetical protein